MSFNLGLNWVREVAVTMLMLLFVFAVNSDIDLAYKIGFSVSVFTIFIILVSRNVRKNYQFETKPSPKLARKLNEGESILWYGRPLRAPFLLGVLEFLSVGIASVAITAYLVLFHAPGDGDVSFFVVLGSVCAGLFLLYGPYHVSKGARDSEYMVTSQRVFFETLTEYAFEEVSILLGGPRTVRVVSLGDVQETYVKRGVHDRIFGTSTLYVRHGGFQRETTHLGTTTVHRPPSFPFIKEAVEVEKIIQEAAERVRGYK